MYYNLSIAYSLGRGVKRNDHKAFLWAKRAAEAGYENTMLAVAWFYFNGTGTAQNLCRAQEWYEKIPAVNPRNVPALFRLGQIYFFKHEYDDACEYFYKAYQMNGHARACYYLGRLFLEKLWPRDDISRAVFFLNIAARKHVYEAKRLLRSKEHKKRNDSSGRLQRKFKRPPAFYNPPHQVVLTIRPSFSQTKKRRNGHAELKTYSSFPRANSKSHIRRFCTICLKIFSSTAGT